jgi:hypothetical protein
VLGDTRREEDTVEMRDITLPRPNYSPKETASTFKAGLMVVISSVPSMPDRESRLAHREGFGKTDWIGEVGSA